MMMMMIKWVESETKAKRIYLLIVSVECVCLHTYFVSFFYKFYSSIVYSVVEEHYIFTLHDAYRRTTFHEK
jgi:hypothetical protein